MKATATSRVYYRYGDVATSAAALVFFLVLHFVAHADPSPTLALILLPALLTSVLAAVAQAERIAHRVGEPAGTIILTLSVTAIEVALITSLTLGGHAASSLVRDTVFSVVMIVCNGLVGLCLLIGGIRHREQDFETQGTNAYFSVLTALSVLTLVLPNFTSSTPGPTLNPPQQGFEAIVTLLLYGIFLYIQTVRHVDYFVSDTHQNTSGTRGFSSQALVWPGSLLLLSLVGVVLLSEAFTESLRAGLASLGAPAALAGFLVAALIMLPEGISAVKAARENDLQRSINLALGSLLANIGLTVPAVAAISLITHQDLILGLEPRSMIFLMLTLLVSGFTFGTGKTNLLYGFVHLVLFATYIFLIFVP